MQLDKNPSLILGHILTLSSGDRKFDQFTWWNFQPSLQHDNFYLFTIIFVFQLVCVSNQHAIQLGTWF